MNKLPSDFAIAVRIYEYNQKEEQVCFTKLVDDFEGSISRTTVSKNIDQLFDLGIITGEWEKADNGKWIRSFKIAGEASGLISAIAEKYSVQE